MLRSRCFRSLLSFLVVSGSSICMSQQSTAAGSAAEVAARHSSIEWLTVAPHLPDPATAAAAKLEVAADVLRARRLADDAIDYYGYAILRGGDQPTLMNKIGVTELEESRPVLARVYFRRVIAIKRKDADAWNNLGATETVSGNLQQAIRDYRRAIRFNGKNALFHANLGTAYFAVQDYESARQQFEVAIRLDGGVFHRGGFGGSQINVLTADDRGRFAFEMARLAAGHHEEETMLHWLSVASEDGFDVRAGMGGLKEFTPYLKDARIGILIENARMMRTNRLRRMNRCRRCLRRDRKDLPIGAVAAV
jgi:tetratricopeptide (TPR) repeat protein